jgi:excisionase family DNA binding protein
MPSTPGSSSQQEKLLHTRNEAAYLLSLSVRTIDNLIANKELTVRRFGKRVMIPHHVLVQFIRSDHSTEAVN